MNAAKCNAPHATTRKAYSDRRRIRRAASTDVMIEVPNDIDGVTSVVLVVVSDVAMAVGIDGTLAVLRFLSGLFGRTTVSEAQQNSTRALLHGPP